MTSFENNMLIVYRWWQPEDKEINEEHKKDLEESALARIHEMMKEGYNQGQLIECIDNVEYEGWWDISHNV